MIKPVGEVKWKGRRRVIHQGKVRYLRYGTLNGKTFTEEFENEETIVTGSRLIKIKGEEYVQLFGTHKGKKIKQRWDRATQIKLNGVIGWFAPFYYMNGRPLVHTEHREMIQEKLNQKERDAKK